MDSRTFWVSRDEDHCLVIWRDSPRNRDGCFVDHREVSDAIDEVSVAIWPALGLPEEPKVGSCWRVAWKDDGIWIRERDTEPRRVLVPFARDVTEKLKKEAADG